MTITIPTFTATKKPTVYAAGASLCSAVAAEPLAVLAPRLAVTLETLVTRFLSATDQNVGHLETQALQEAQSLLREATQRAAQAKAEATPTRRPVCGGPLSRSSSGHARTFLTRFGDITVRRTPGDCKRCHKGRTPANAALGLGDTAGCSPSVQAMAALAASTMPIADASVVLEHLSDVKPPPATLDHQAKRQGERAQRLRTQLDAHAATDQRQLELTLEP